MSRVLITAFEPYDRWRENASWLTLREFTRDLPSFAAVTTRKFPVDFGRVREQLGDELRSDLRYAIFLGQAPGRAALQLETTALNIRPSHESLDGFQSLEPNGPAAYTSSLPLASWAMLLRQQGIPTQVSHHAGTYLCNAIYYWGQWFTEQRQTACQCLFIHLPLAPGQAAECEEPFPSLATPIAARALQTILQWCHHQAETA